MYARIVLLLMIIGALQGTYNNPLLVIKIPTRSRPTQFFTMLDCYFRLLSREVAYHFLISCDADDLAMNNEQVREKLKQYPHLSVFFGDNHTKTQAYNADMDKIEDWDIVLVASDDLEPIAKNYDKIIIQKMLQYFPDFDGVLNFYDGHVADNLNTYPVIGRKFYERFGYIYNPVYKSVCTDSELTAVSRALGKEMICNNILLNHKHPIWGFGNWDELYKKNEEYVKQDLRLFFARRDCNFDLIKSE